MSVTPIPLDPNKVAWPDGTLWPVQKQVLGSRANLADFGANLATTDIDDAVIATLKKWMPTYLDYVERSRHLGFTLARPKASNYAAVIDNDQFLDHSLPGIFVATARTQGQPTVADDGSYITTWLVAVSAVVRGRTPQETRRLSSYYELAFRMALAQHGDLGGVAGDIRWVGGGESRPLDDPSGRGRWLGEGASQFWVFTDAAVSRNAGPVVPDQEPYQPLATVESVDVEVDGAAIEPTGGS